MRCAPIQGRVVVECRRASTADPREIDRLSQLSFNVGCDHGAHVCLIVRA